MVPGESYSKRALTENLRGKRQQAAALQSASHKYNYYPHLVIAGNWLIYS